MATGQAPFGGDSTMQVMYQHVTQVPKDPKLVNPGVPDYLAAVILKCLQKDPHQAVPSSAGDSPRSGIRHGADSVWYGFASQKRAIRNGCWPQWLRCFSCVAGDFRYPILAQRRAGPFRCARATQTGISGQRQDKYVAVLPFKTY